MTDPASSPASVPSTALPRALVARAWGATAGFRPVLLILIALVIFFSLTQDGFLTGSNTRNLLTGVSMLWIVAIATTFVLISGGIDLSIGATVALTGIFTAKILALGVPPVLAIVLAVAFGAAVGGLINGGLIGGLGLSFFVVTLASLTALTGVVNLWTDTKTIFVREPLINDIGMGSIAGIAVPIWLMALTLVVGLWIQHRTYLGRDIYAIGGSPTAARLSGIRVVRTTIIVYALVGACAGLASLIAVGRIGAASPTVDSALALNAAAAVLLGGTSLMGGVGGLGGTVFGVLFIGVLQNGLSIAGVQSFWQQVVTGLILVLAVLGDRFNVRGGVAALLVAWRGRGADPAGPPALPGATP